ncbi:MAG TPA: PKD domain-containing protein, partial [Bacteroidales bacterium]|nr:PKD domain-containing protein [Bacteroidales bacterium]
MITKGRIKLLAMLFTGITIFFTTGCEDNNSPTPSGSLVADAGADQTATTGQQVTLDGSNSSDKNRDSFDFAWTFKSKPAGSTATLSGADTDSPSFVPDVAGDYVLQLTISNPNGESTDEVTVTVTAPEGLQEKSGTVQNEHWQKVNGAGQPDYLITGDLSIEGDLTIDPGVIVLIQEDVLISIQQSGSLNASG